MISKVKRRTLQIGDKVLNDRYEVSKVIHTSGMANVYLVFDKNLNKQWCLKEIVKSEAGKENIEKISLLREANIMKSLNHSGIPRIVTIEDDGDSIFIVMDFIDGFSVREWLRKKGAIKEDVAVKWIQQVCNVMLYLHNRKHPIVYLDMKPDNIMIQDDGNIKLLDFGISQIITKENSIIKKPLGTKGYAAPEQSKVGLPYDLRSDIYSIGMTLYHMLTGISPAVVKGSLKPIRSVNSNLSVGLEYIIGKCIMKDPNDRYQSIEELLYDLKTYDRLDLTYRKRARRKVNTVISLFGVSVLLLITSFIPLGLYSSEQSNLYNEKVNLASQTGRFDDYIYAISLKPLELEPYQGLIDSIKTDGVFTKDEETSLLNLINPNLNELKNNSNYGQLAYNIGKLYWYYYEGEDGDVVSSKWFKESLDKGFNTKESKVYYDLGNFKKNISMSIAESSDTGLYKEYWDNLMSAKSIDSGEIIELQLYNSIADAISTYSYRMAKDGVPKEDMLNEIDDMNKFLEASNPTSDKAIELKSKLSESVQSLAYKVNLAYSEGGAK